MAEDRSFQNFAALVSFHLIYYFLATLQDIHLRLFLLVSSLILY